MELVLNTSVEALLQLYYQNRELKGIIEDLSKNRAVVRYKKDIILSIRATCKNILLIEDYFEEITCDFPDRDKATVYACFASCYFAKLYDVDKAFAYVKRNTEDKRYKLVEEKFYNFNLEEYLNSIDDFLKRLSLKHNFPYWIVKLLSKQIAKDSLEGCLISLKAKTNDYYFTEKDLSRDSSYVQISDNIYQSVESVRKDPEIIPVNYPFIRFVEHFKISNHQNIFIYIDKNPDFLKYLLSNTPNPFAYYNVGIGENINPYSVKSIFKNKFITNYNIFECRSDTSAEAAISEKVDLAVVYPYSLNLNRAREALFLIKFRQGILDSLILRQKNLLEIASKRLTDDGALVYLSDTFERKETTDIIEDFLSRHKEFYIDKVRTYYPFENNAAGYAVVLKKK